MTQNDRKRPIAVDLFAGAGGMSLGFEQAGFDVPASVEIDPVHCAVHKFNFPQTAVIPYSVDKLSGKAIRASAGLSDENIDCVFGGAPCQGFSLIGQRVLDDPRNRLVLEFVRIVKELDATTFVFENVKGLTLGKHKQFLTEFVQACDEAGYDVVLPWKVLKAAHYGTPQNRERLFLMGVRKGGKLPTYPNPTTNAAGKTPRFDALPFGPTCVDALGDLPDAEAFEELRNSDQIRTTKFSTPSSYAAELRCLNNEAWHFGYVRDWDPLELTSSARTDHTEISRRRFSETEDGKVEPISRFFKLPAKGVANTLRAGTDGSRGAFTSPRPIHYRFPRCVTVREMARLHGFPDWFRFHSTKWHGARQIGNAVPPPLARAVGSSIVQSLGYEPNRPNNILMLGAAPLLYMTVGEAAEHFGVPAPANRRDRKSGSKKRKQSEIELERLGKRAANA